MSDTNRSTREDKPRTIQECEAIIEEMTDALIFALRFWKYTGGCAQVNGKLKTPIYWFAEVLEKVGIAFDKEDLKAQHWPAKERRKYFAEKAKNKAKEAV